MTIFDYGFPPELVPQDGIAARVTAVHKERYELFCKYGLIYGRLKSAVYYLRSEQFPITGDYVSIRYIADGDSQILATLPRKTYFSRRDPLPGKGELAVAANFDYVFIMQSLNHDFNLKRLERYLTLAWQSRAQPVVLLTKADLADDVGAQLAAAQRIAADAPVLAVSSRSGFGLDRLAQYLQPRKTIVFLGSSGVGKSSLVNTLAGETVMSVNAIREDDSRGRHTTTHRQLIMLKSGVMIIDTPGMRELGMWDVSSGLGDAFADVEQYLGECRFSDCSHHTEPGCAIRAALERGELSPERWRSYCRLQEEAEYIGERAAYMKRKQQWSKAVAKRCKNLSKNWEED